MSTNPKQSIPTLLAEWGQMSERQRDAECALIDGWEWATFVDMGRTSLMFPPGWCDDNCKSYLSWERGKSGEPDYECVSFFDSRRGGKTYWAVPAYTSEDSPASLVAGLEEKVIGMLRAKDAKKQGQYAGHIDSGDLLLKYAKRVVMHESENGAAEELAVYRMTRKQRACACWLAVKMEGMDA